MKIKKIMFLLNIFFLTVLSLIFLYPLLITFTNSFMTNNEIIRNYIEKLNYIQISQNEKVRFVRMTLFPQEISFIQYKEIFINQPSFLILLSNSIKIVFPTIFFNLIVSLLTAFGFITWKFKHKNFVFGIYVLTTLMPLQATLVSNYLVIDFLNLKNTHWSIILPGIFSPFGTFILVQSLAAIPKEYFEAAATEGCSNFMILIKIVLPQIKSGIAALLILNFIEYWNVVEQVIVFIDDYKIQPLSIFLSRIANEHITLVFAVSVVYMLIPFWLLIIFQEDLKMGIELSGIK